MEKCVKCGKELAPGEKSCMKCGSIPNSKTLRFPRVRAFIMTAVAWLLAILVIVALILMGTVAIKKNNHKAYITKNAVDVAELKDGGKIIGKITVDTPSKIYIKQVIDDSESSVSRDNIRLIRKITADELLYISKMITYEDVAKRERTKAIVKIDVKNIISGINLGNIKAEVESAMKSKKILENKLKARNKVAPGMSEYDVLNAWGEPVNKATQEEDGQAITRWYYPSHGGAVVFSCGVVQCFEYIKEESDRFQ